MLHVKSASERGRGVFTDAPIQQGAVIEVCPILRLSSKDVDALEPTILDSYIYVWGEGYCVVFGYGMLYNHSEDPNVVTREDHEKEVMIITAKRDIVAGEELVHDYSEAKRPIIFRDGHWMYADTLKRE